MWLGQTASYVPRGLCSARSGRLSANVMRSGKNTSRVSTIFNSSLIIFGVYCPMVTAFGSGIYANPWLMASVSRTISR